MEHSDYARILRTTSCIGAAGLALLRAVTLRTSFDENGLLPRGSLILPLTVLACLCVFGAMWFLASRLNGLPATEYCFSFRRTWLIPKLIAAELLMLGGLLALLDGKVALTRAETLLAAAEPLVAILMLWSALQRRRRSFLFWVRLGPAVFTGASLILRFQAWSHDPLVIHIVPSLLAWVCCMVEMMLLSGFSLNVGHRRSGALFGLAAGVFACMALPDYLLTDRVTLPELLTLTGLAAWCCTYALELLRYRVQEEYHAPTPQEEPEELDDLDGLYALNEPGDPDEPDEPDEPDPPETVVEN